MSSRLPTDPIRRIFAPLLFLLLLLAPAAARADDPDELIRFTDARGDVIEGGVWLPDDAGQGGARPLVVISHGNGGWFMGHHDTAGALTRAGFIVAALTHPGDNYRDQRRSLQLTGRAPQLSALIDYMTRDWTGPVFVDPERIGALGFSAGGFTVTSIIGGVSDGPAILEHCAAHPEFFACRLLAMGQLDLAVWQPGTRDDRVRAAVIAAPALGVSFTSSSLASVTVPVQLWQAADDRILPAPFNVEPIRDRLGRAPDYRLVPEAGHYDFLTPCSEGMRAELPELCTSAPGFDRAAFKTAFNDSVVGFFREALR